MDTDTGDIRWRYNGIDSFAGLDMNLSFTKMASKRWAVVCLPTDPCPFHGCLMPNISSCTPAKIDRFANSR